MNYFENSREATLGGLSTIVNEDGKRVYSDRLLQSLSTGDFNCLNEVSLEDRNNRFFMEPLLFAVRNSEYGTYEIYKYYGEQLQKENLTIVTEIIVEEPDVIQDTSISDNAAIMIYLAQINPEVVMYMSEDLKNDGEFIEALCKTGDKDIIRYAASECNISEVLQDNPELANNPIFMGAAIKEDVTALAHVSEELKNNYDFIKEVAMENREVTDYVAEHTEEFGKDALKGARAAVETHFIKDATKDVKEAKQKLVEEKQKLEEQGKDEKTSKEIEKKEKDLKSIEDMMRKFEETPEEKKPRRAHWYLQAIKDKPEYAYYIKELEKYEKIYIAEKEKEEKEKAKALNQEKQKGEYKISHDEIEKVAEESTPSKMNGQFKIMEETLAEEKTKDNMEVEKNYDERSKVER